jgi:hypothetical protein
MARENNVTGFDGKNGKKKYCNVILIVDKNDKSKIFKFVWFSYGFITKRLSLA